jgi:hypothetical protein
METQTESANVPQDIRAMRKNLRATDSYRRTIYDARLSNALAVYGKSTR